MTCMVPAFRPQWTARMGAQELYEAYRRVGLTLSDVEEGRYIRIKEIRRQQSAGRLDSELHWTTNAAEAALRA
jgi:hypothetical protein